MNILIFDTETISVNKPFCYNVGYVIVDTETKNILLKKDFVIEQIWHNMALFSTAYYADKRPIYVSRMKAQKAKMTKFGQVMRAMRADISKFNIEFAYAYNSKFDEGVFDFNCEWFKVANPFDNVKIIDIRPIAMNTICEGADYKAYCDKLSMYTESGNYSTTAEAVYRYIAKDGEFIEEHTALSDSIIETAILLNCMEQNADIFIDHKSKRTIERKTPIQLTIKKYGKIIYQYDCEGYTVSKKYDTIYLK